jgi:hypothetical protein
LGGEQLVSRYLTELEVWVAGCRHAAIINSRVWEHVK